RPKPPPLGMFPLIRRPVDEIGVVVVVTRTVTVSDTLSPDGSVALNVNCSVVAVDGAVKLAVGVLSPVTTALGPCVCVHWYASTAPVGLVTVAASVTGAFVRTVWSMPASTVGAG